MRIAKEGNHPEVAFKFSYDALTKTGIALIALCGYKTKSRQGHHIKILEKLSQLLEDEEIENIGDRMRKKRNLDLCGGGIIVSKKEAKGYLGFTESVIVRAEKYLKNQSSLFENR